MEGEVSRNNPPARIKQLETLNRLKNRYKLPVDLYLSKNQFDAIAAEAKRLGVDFSKGIPTTPNSPSFVTRVSENCDCIA